MSTRTSPRVAVLLPVYNGGPELKETLESIRNQTVPSRLFLVDDGSKTKPDYAALLKGIDHRLIELAQNQGITGAMNAGLAEILKGDFDYVARIDNGDINDLKRFETQIAYLESHPDVAMVGSQVRAEFELSGLKFELRYPESHDDCVKAMRYNSAMWHGAIMFRISFFRAMKSYSHEYPAAEDYAMAFWAIKNGFRIGNVPQMLYRTIEMTESISGGSRTKQLRSRLKLQRENANWLDLHSWLGVARTIFLLYAPVTLLRRLKSAVR